MLIFPATWLPRPVRLLLACLCLAGGGFSGAAQETVGGGTVGDPAAGPAPSYNIGGAGFVLVKNWNFGTSAGSTVKSMADLNAHFMYHDQFGVYNNGGGNYGTHTVAPDAANALGGQPIEGANTGGLPVRQFFTDSLKTYLVPLNGATTVDPALHNSGCGSFVAKWRLPNGGLLFNQDLVWETRVRYVTPKYFWFAIWTAGNLWNKGAEMDVIESFGYDNGGSFTNYTGRYWHSDCVGGTNTTSYPNWGNGMSSRGVTTFDATQYHIWTWLYRKDNTYSAYMDGTEVQNGAMNWTYGGGAAGTPIDISFLFDGAWGHTGIDSVNHPLPASDFTGKFYEWDYSRVYLKLAPAAGPLISGYSSHQPGFEAAKSLDGVENADNNGWSAKTAGYPQWIEVDLGSDRQINGTQLVSTAGRAYRFQVQAKSAAGSYQPVVDRTSSTQASPITNSFTAVTARYVRLTVTGAFNYSGNQVSIREFKVSVLPTAPAGLAASAVSSARVDLAWQDNVDNETGFKIERKAGAGGFSQINSIAAGATAFQDSGVQPQTAYTYRIRANNAAGDSPYTSEVSATTPTPYEDWAKAAISLPVERGELQDADHDGVVNFLERAFAQGPQAPGGPGFPHVESGGGGFYLVYQRNLTAAELTYKVETSAEVSGPWLAGPEHVTEEILSTAGNIQTVKAIPLDPSGNQYMRVTVTAPY